VRGTEGAPGLARGVDDTAWGTPGGMSTSALPEDTPSLAERFRFGELLGVGATAEVYRAVERATGRQVAVKLLSPELMLLHGLPPRLGEDDTAARLDHPGLVAVHETGHDRGRFYLIMQLVDGETLYQRLLGGPVPAPQVTAIGTSLADALSYIHGKGVIHRDLKPANILLDGQGRPFLTDFGASRLVDATRITTTGAAIGTPAYMAPEQIRGEHVGPAADIYALGLVLLEAVTGRREYPGGLVESAVSRLHRRPAVPDDLPEPLRPVLRAMTGDDPATRPTAADVRDRLSSRAVREPVPPHRSRTTPPRRSSVLVGTAAAVLIAAAGLGTMALQAPAPATTTAGDRSAAGPAPTANGGLSPAAAAIPPVVAPAPVVGPAAAVEEAAVVGRAAVDQVAGVGQAGMDRSAVVDPSDSRPGRSAPEPSASSPGTDREEERRAGSAEGMEMVGSGDGYPQADHRSEKDGRNQDENGEGERDEKGNGGGGKMKD
jgi:hypothetical protein